MWTITGGCYYSLECERWCTSSCDSCQGNESFTPRIISPEKVYLHKKNQLTEKKILFVAPSKWMQNCALKGILKNEEVRQIYNGTSLMNFNPLDKKICRKELGISDDKYNLLFLSADIDSPFKGYKYLRNALGRLANPEKYRLILVGNQTDTSIAEIETKSFGYISDKTYMNKIYSSADLYVLPSVADNLPTTCIEAMSCGTPVVAFRTGGIPELVPEDVGWLVDSEDEEGLACTIENALRDKEKLSLKTSRCIKYAVEKFSQNAMYLQYKKLYKEILDGF